MNLIAMLLTSMVAAHSTYWLTHSRKMGPVRAAGLSTLVFLGVSSLLSGGILSSLQTTFYGAAFVGMSEPSRLKERSVLAASILFALLFALLKKIEFVRFQGGVGGTLGATAFVSCLSVYWIQVLIARIIRYRAEYNSNKSTL